MMSSLRFFALVVSVMAALTSGFMPLNGKPLAPSSTRVWGGPAVLDREATATRGSGPAVLDRPEVEERRTTKEPTRDRKHQGNEAWEVRIYNDGLNTREHVARSLVQVTGMSELVAYQTMMQAHQNGIAVVGRWVFEIAEMYHDELKRNGIVCDIIPVDESS